VRQRGGKSPRMCTAVLHAQAFQLPLPLTAAVPYRPSLVLCGYSVRPYVYGVVSFIRYPVAICAKQFCVAVKRDRECKFSATSDGEFVGCDKRFVSTVLDRFCA
jgi:hypothetical protein